MGEGMPTWLGMFEPPGTLHVGTAFRIWALAGRTNISGSLARAGGAPRARGFTSCSSASSGVMAWRGPNRFPRRSLFIEVFSCKAWMSNRMKTGTF